jgi:hypothetical protein
MAGDGGRVPDVSEQRAEDRCATCDEDSAGAECSRLEADLLDIHDALADPDEASAINAAWIIERIEALKAPPDPASVLAALLAEHPDATIAALETLLTSSEAGEAISEFFERGYRSHWCAEWQAKGRCQLCADAAQIALSAACRSLRPKTPKEDRDA